MRFLSVGLLVLFPAAIFGRGTVENDLVGKTTIELIKKYGKQYSLRMLLIDSEYFPVSEIEPDYSKHFTSEELSRGVKIMIMGWDKGNRSTVLWLKKEGDSWIVFSSVRYNKKWVSY